MFFVRGLSTNGKEVFVNPDQVLYVCPVGFLRKRSALVLTHRKRLVVDQNTQTVRQRFEDYLRDIGEIDEVDAPSAREFAKSGQRSILS